MGFFDRAARELGKIGEAVLGGIGAAIPVLAGGLAGGLAQRIQVATSGGRPVVVGARGAVALPGLGFPAPSVTPGIAGPSEAFALPFPEKEFGFMPVATALPGGAPVATRAGAGFGLLGDIASQLFGGGGGVSLPTAPGVAPGGVFEVVGPRLRARSLFHITNPSTGREVWYRNVGQPILFSGDIRAVKRVRRVAGFARRAVGRKR